MTTRLQLNCSPDRRPELRLDEGPVAEDRAVTTTGVAGVSMLVTVAVAVATETSAMALPEGALERSTVTGRSASATVDHEVITE
jgi:hypothetical protein